MERGPTCVVDGRAGRKMRAMISRAMCSWTTSLSGGACRILSRSFVVAAGVRDSDDVTRRAACVRVRVQRVAVDNAGLWLYERRQRGQGVLIGCIQGGRRDFARGRTAGAYGLGLVSRPRPRVSRTRVLAPTLQVRARRCPTMYKCSLAMYLPALGTRASPCSASPTPSLLCPAAPFARSCSGDYSPCFSCSGDDSLHYHDVLVSVARALCKVDALTLDPPARPTVCALSLSSRALLVSRHLVAALVRTLARSASALDFERGNAAHRGARDRCGA